MLSCRRAVDFNCCKRFASFEAFHALTQQSLVQFLFLCFPVYHFICHLFDHLSGLPTTRLRGGMFSPALIKVSAPMMLLSPMITSSWWRCSCPPSHCSPIWAPRMMAPWPDVRTPLPNNPPLRLRETYEWYNFSCTLQPSLMMICPSRL